MTYPNFDAISPERSICFLPFDGSFRQDVGENLLVNGGFEADFAGWYTTLSGGHSIRTDSPAEGSKWAEFGTGSGSRLRQTLTTIGHMYHGTGFSKRASGGTKTYVALGGSLVEQTTLTTWVPWDLVQTATGTLVQLYQSGTGTVGFDGNEVYEHPQVCRSLSKQVGALNYARMGDGHTASTMPTQIPGRRGLRFNQDYVTLDWAAGGALDTTSMTFICYASVKESDVYNARRLFDIGTLTDAYTLFFQLSSSSLVFERRGSPTLRFGSTEGYPDGQDHVYAFTIDSTGLRVHKDDKVIVSVAGDIRLPSFDLATQAMIGAIPAYPSSPNYTFVGDMYSAAIYPFALSQTQVREWGRRARQMRNI